jgi:hypothetical protein
VDCNSSALMVRTMGKIFVSNYPKF